MKMHNVETLLGDVLKEKQSHNPNYSLRALARDLRIEQSQLTRVLNGQQKASPIIAYKLSLLMNLDTEQTLDMIKATFKERRKVKSPALS